MVAHTEHPCLNCRLPDCDDGSKACELRKALNEYDRYKRAKIPAPVEVRRRNAIAYREFYAVAKRERALQRRQTAEVA